MHVVPLQPAQLDQVLTVHLQSFPGFFLSFLGPRFLREFYRSFLDDPAGMAFVAVDEQGRVQGVVAGPQSPDGYFRRLLKRRWWAFCLASTGAVLRRPTIVPRLFRAVFYRGEAPSGPPRALLSSIAVAPSAQGQGVGRLLVNAWVAEARRRGCTGCFLTTDRDGNDAVNTFYQRLGWRLADSYATPQGRQMNRYVLDLTPPPAS